MLYLSLRSLMSPYTRCLHSLTFSLLQYFEVLYLLFSPSLYVLLHPANKQLSLLSLALTSSSTRDNICSNLYDLLLRLNILLALLSLSLFASSPNTTRPEKLYVISLCNDLHVLLLLLKLLYPSLLPDLLLPPPLKLPLSLQKRLTTFNCWTCHTSTTTFHSVRINRIHSIDSVDCINRIRSVDE